MKELFEQSSKMMEKTWSLWEQMISESPWLKKPEAGFVGKWSPWIATMRSTYDINMNAWKTYVEQCESTLFKMLKDAPFHSEALETQLREMWEGLKKAQNLQHQIARDYLEKMEGLLKERE